MQYIWIFSKSEMYNLVYATSYIESIILNHILNLFGKFLFQEYMRERKKRGEGREREERVNHK